MKARQRIYTREGKRLGVRTGARLQFKLAHLGRHWWKWYNAARFELWRVDGRGRRTRRVRVGAKIAYCLRDLRRTRPGVPRSPKRAVYPACNTYPARKRVTLGTSPGWSDIYPPTYPEQWIDVSGLRGCFAYVHIADPTQRALRGERGQQRVPGDRATPLPLRHPAGWAAAGPTAGARCIRGRGTEGAAFAGFAAPLTGGRLLRLGRGCCSVGVPSHSAGVRAWPRGVGRVFGVWAVNAPGSRGSGPHRAERNGRHAGVTGTRKNEPGARATTHPPPPRRRAAPPPLTAPGGSPAPAGRRRPLG